MVNLLLGASLLLFFLWIASFFGAMSMHTAWILLVVAWWLGTAWCGAWYMKSRHHEHPPLP